MFGTYCGANMASGVMTAIYWLVVMLSVISTGPTFIFNTSNRFVKVWKTEKVPQRVKLFVSIIRVRKKDKADAEAAAAQKSEQ